MKVIYIGTANSLENLQYYASISKEPLVYTQQNWDYSLCKELQNRIRNDLTVLSYPPIDCVPNCRRIFIRSRSISNINNGKVVGTILLPFVKQIVVERKLHEEVKKVIRKHINEEIIIITHTIYYQSLKVAFEAKRKCKKVKVVSLVPDMPEFSSRTIKNSFIIKLYNRLTIRTAMNVDGYVCFSKHQMENLNKQKPYIVLNGFIDSSILSCTAVKNHVVSLFESDKSVKILYAGKISKEMGIDCFLEAFQSLKNSNIRLYLCGNGDYVECLKNVKDNRIVYLGVLPRSIIIELEKKSNLLVNPRLINEEFSKKSFPSKIFEYLASGTPVLSSHLKCFSSEYDKCMVYFESNTIEEYTTKILYCIKNMNYLQKMALYARKFILSNKSVQKYCDSLIQFIGYKNENN